MIKLIVNLNDVHFLSILALSITMLSLIISVLSFIPFCRVSITSLFSFAVDFNIAYCCFSILSTVTRICAAMSWIFFFCWSLSTRFGIFSAMFITPFEFLYKESIISLLWPNSLCLFANISFCGSCYVLCHNSFTSLFKTSALFWKYKIFGSSSSSSFFWTYLIYSVIVLYLF